MHRAVHKFWALHTFRDFGLIFINDESTDGMAARERRWLPSHTLGPSLSPRLYSIAMQCVLAYTSSNLEVYQSL